MAGLKFAGDPGKMDLEMAVQIDFFDLYGIGEIFLGGTVCQPLKKIPFQPGKAGKDPENESQECCCQEQGEKDSSLHDYSASGFRGA